MKRFREYYTDVNQESYLIEMPHIDTDDELVDLELEIYSNMNRKDYLDHFVKLLKGERIPSKNSGTVFQIDPSHAKQVAKELLNNQYLFLFTEKHYGKKIKRQLEKLLKSYA